MTLGAVESTPSSLNITLAAQNEDIYTGHGNGGQGLEAELEQLLKASFFILQTPLLTKLTGIPWMIYGLLSKRTRSRFRYLPNRAQNKVRIV